MLRRRRPTDAHSDGPQRALSGHSDDPRMAIRWPSDRNQTQSDGPRIAIRRNQMALRGHSDAIRWLSDRNQRSPSHHHTTTPSHLSELSGSFIWQDLVKLTTCIGPLGGQGHPCTFVTPAAERCSEREGEGQAGAGLEDSGGLYR